MIRKVASFLMVLCILAASCPLYASAGNYEITVCGIEVTTENASDVFGDGTVRYNSDTSVLTLDNANLDGEIMFGKGVCAIISLIGENILNSDETAITATDGLTYTGEGSLEVTASENGIYTESYLDFAHTGSITLNGGEAAIYGESADIKVTSGRLYAYGGDSGDTYGVFCHNGTYAQTMGTITTSGTKAAVLVMSETAGELITLGERIKVSYGGNAVSGNEGGTYWTSFSTVIGSGKNAATLDDVSKKIITVKLCTITQEGENFFLCDKDKEELPQLIAPGEMLAFCVFADSGYSAGEDFVVKVNGKPITAVSGQYTIDEIKEDIVITVEGMVEQSSVSKEVSEEEKSLEGFFDNLDMVKILGIAFVICLIALTAYVAVTANKEEKRKAAEKYKGKK